MLEQVFFKTAELDIEMDQGSKFMEPPATPWLASLIVVPQFKKLSAKTQKLVRAAEVQCAWSLIEQNEP